MPPIRVTIWNEFHHEKHNPDAMAIYPDGIHSRLKEALACDDFIIRTAYLEQDEEHGLSEEVLEQTDVLLWWGHLRHKDVSDAVVSRVCQHVLNGMGFIPLHSAHKSKPFCALMGTSCTLGWRCADEHCREWLIAPTHPIAKGIPPHFTIEKEEMYGEFFDIPKPDEIIFLTWFPGGDVFRGGCTFTRGQGKIFYFHPGHETYPTYYNPTVIQVIKNAIYWAVPADRKSFDGGLLRTPLEPLA